MIIDIVSLLCLVAMALGLVVVIMNIALKKRPERIKYIRNFKKGKCAVIFIIAIPIYVMGLMYTGANFIQAFFGCINKIFNLVVLKYDFTPLQALMTDNIIYRITVYICCLLVGLNAIMFTLSLTSQYIWNYISTLKARFSPKDKLFIFGYGEENISICASDTDHSKLVINDLSKEERNTLYFNKIPYVSTKEYKMPIKRIFKIATNLKKENIVVVNTLSDDNNLRICKEIAENLCSLDECVKSEIFMHLRVFVFGNPDYEALYNDIVSSSFGCIHYVNKYQEIAMNFIENYPFTRFMNENHIDYKTSLVKKNVDINVCMLGFGKTNRQIFLTSVANNQFLGEGEKGVELKKVQYHIFDKEFAEKNKNLNHNYYRYKNEFSTENKENYLPLPSFPAQETYYHLDINDSEFYGSIKKVVAKSAKDINFIIIAFGTDLENMDMAQKLVEKRREWGLVNLVIFVKVRGWRKEQTVLSDEDCYFIANENEIVYNIENISGDIISKMAKMRNEVYDLEYNITHSKDVKIDDEYILKNHKKADENWYKEKTQLERESSLYCCLSLKSKLNMMGLDYVRADADKKGLTQEEYLSVYADGDLPDFEHYNLCANGKPIAFYDLDFKQSRRTNMAIQEHYRWNSFMISKGMIPASTDKIKNETILRKDGKTKFTNGRNYFVRRHGNLTTFEGLVDFRRIIAERDNVSEEETDVIKYDYQILDDAFWLLNENGYKIVRR